MKRRRKSTHRRHSKTICRVGHRKGGKLKKGWRLARGGRCVRAKRCRGC